MNLRLKPFLGQRVDLCQKFDGRRLGIVWGIEPSRADVRLFAAT